MINIEVIEDVEKTKQFSQSSDNSKFSVWTLSPYSSWMSQNSEMSSNTPMYTRIVNIERVKVFLDEGQLNNDLLQKYKQYHFKNQLLLQNYLSVQSNRFKYIARHYLNKRSIKINNSKRAQYQFQLKVEKGEQIVKKVTSAAGEAKALWDKDQVEVMQWILNITEGIIQLEGAGIFHADLAIRNTIKVDGVYKIIDFDLAFKVKRTEDQGKQGVRAFERTKFLLQLILDNSAKDNYLINNYLFRDTTQECQYCPLQQIIQIKNNKYVMHKVQPLLKLLQNYSLIYHRVQFKAIIQELLNAKRCKLNKEISEFILNTASRINQWGNLTTIKDYLILKAKENKSSSKKNIIQIHEKMQQQEQSDQSLTSEGEDSSQWSKDRCSEARINSESIKFSYGFNAKSQYMVKEDKLRQVYFQNQLFLFRYLSSNRKAFKYIANHYFDKKTLQRDKASNTYFSYDLIYEKGQQYQSQPEKIMHEIMMGRDNRGKQYVFHWVICLIRAIIELQEAGIFCVYQHWYYIRTAKYHFKIVNVRNLLYLKVANYCNQRVDRSLLRRTKTLLKQVLNCVNQLNYDQPASYNHPFISRQYGILLLFMNNYVFSSMSNINDSAKSAEDKIEELMELFQIQSLVLHIYLLQKILQSTFQESDQSLYAQIKDKVDSINVADKFKNREGYEQLIAMFKKWCSKCTQPNCVCCE